MKIFQNKMVVGGICIALAAVFAFVLLPGMNKNKSGTVKIVKFNTDVLPGTYIDETMLTEKEVGGYGLPDSVVKDKAEIVGKYAVCDIKADDYILSSKISDFAADERLDRINAEGRKLITVTLSSIAAGVGNYLKAGDKVSILCFKDDAVAAYDELKNLEVYSVQNDDAVNVENAQDDDAEGKIATTITLVVNDAQAQKLVFAEYSGKIHAVFEKRG